MTNKHTPHINIQKRTVPTYRIKSPLKFCRRSIEKEGAFYQIRSKLRVELRQPKTREKHSTHVLYWQNFHSKGFFIFIRFWGWDDKCECGRDGGTLLISSYIFFFFFIFYKEDWNVSTDFSSVIFYLDLLDSGDLSPFVFVAIIFTLCSLPLTRYQIIFYNEISDS